MDLPYFNEAAWFALRRPVIPVAGCGCKGIGISDTVWLEMKRIWPLFLVHGFLSWSRIGELKS